MKAWLLQKFGGLDQVVLGNAPDPKAEQGEVVLRVQLAGLNPADRYLAENQYPTKASFPHVLGRDGLGTVIEVGPGVTEFKVGDRALVLRSEIGVNRWGTFAEKVAVPVESLAAIPSGWSDEQAGGAALVYLTAHQALSQWGNEHPIKTVLITGASGGVGVACVQLAAAAGQDVIALSRDATKREKLIELGAKWVFDPQRPTWSKQVREALGEKRVDLAIDNIGGEGFNDLLGTLGMNGRVSVVGRLAGPVPNFNTASLFFRRLRIGGVAVGTYSPSESQAEWNRIVQTLNAKNIRPLVDSVFGFEELKPAFEKLAKGPMGKVLIRVAE